MAREKKREEKVAAKLELLQTPGETQAGQGTETTPYQPLEPDNKKSCKHFIEDLNDNTYTAFIACIGSEEFN